MRIKIYQIDPKRDSNGVKFHGLQQTEQFQGKAGVDSSLYDEVFNGEVESVGLEDIYRQFNTIGHPLYRGHSLSVSDVVVVNNHAYFCQPVGFQEIPFDESLTQKSEELMTIVYIEPGKKPFISEIENTLEAQQKAVGGLIELVYNEEGTSAIICNEEGKLMGMKGNRRIGNGKSIIAGPFFIAGIDGDDFRSLTDEEVTKYMEVFSEPEQISPEEVQSDVGFEIYYGM